MTENHQKRRLVTREEHDTLGKLPDHVIDTILNRLPIEDAARTSILSKKWRYTWTTMTSLVFLDPFATKFSKNGAYGHNGFIRTISHIVILHKGPILKFHLRIPNIVLDTFQEIDHWMLTLQRNGVRDLALVNFNRHYQLPSYVFSCLELRSLLLSNCIFKPPHEVQEFLYLRDLNLFNIDFRSKDVGGTIMINLPQLNTLSLRRCTNISTFNMKAIILRTLIVINCPDAMLLRFLHSQYLTRVNIALLKPIQDFVRAERLNLAGMFFGLPNITGFSIDGYFLKFLIAGKIQKRLPLTVPRLKGLSFQIFSFGDMDQLQGALCMLRSSPNLELLIIKNFPMGSHGMHFDEESTSNYLKAPDCLDQTLNNLRTVEITSVEGTRPELIFIKLILHHSPSLEKMTIEPCRTTNAQKRLDIAKDVMQFPRASAKAELVYLEPKP